MEPRRLLLVEDDHLTSALLEDLLVGRGFEVRVASSAVQAREALDEFDPDANGATTGADAAEHRRGGQSTRGPTLLLGRCR